MSGLRGRVYATGTIKTIRTVNSYNFNDAYSYVELVQAPAPSANPPGKVIFDFVEAASNAAPALSITAISPTSETPSGNTSVPITGTGFLAGAGTVDVVVTNTDSRSVTLSNRFAHLRADTVTRSFEETIVGL